MIQPFEVHTETPDYAARYLESKGLADPTARECRSLNIGRRMAIRAVEEFKIECDGRLSRCRRRTRWLAIVAVFAMGGLAAWVAPRGTTIPADPDHVSIEEAIEQLESHVDPRIRRSAMRITSDASARIIAALKVLRDTAETPNERARAKAVLRNISIELDR